MSRSVLFKKIHVSFLSDKTVISLCYEKKIFWTDAICSNYNIGNLIIIYFFISSKTLLIVSLRCSYILLQDILQYIFEGSLKIATDWAIVNNVNIKVNIS